MILDKTSAAIYSILNAGTALTARLAGTTAIYDGIAPDGATFDYVTFHYQGGGPEMQDAHDLENNLWTVKVLSKTGFKQASETFTETDALLHKKNISITGYSTFWCARETNLHYVETTPDETKIYHVGGIYRLRTSG